MKLRKFRKLLAIAAISGFASSAYAINPGFYMGLMMGPATNGGSTATVQVQPLPTANHPTAYTSTANPKSTQFGSRLYLGYKFNQYAGFEGGFTYFSGINYILANQQTGCPANGGPCVPAGGTTARVRSIDVVGKIDYSYSNTIGIFGKLGVAAVYTTTPGALNVTSYKVIVTSKPNAPVVTTKTINSGSNTYQTKLAPVFALGASYDLNQNWQMDLTWTREFVGSSLGYMDLYSLGLSYHFVDKYCGQFLCDD